MAVRGQSLIAFPDLTEHMKNVESALEPPGQREERRTARGDEERGVVKAKGGDTCCAEVLPAVAMRKQLRERERARWPLSGRDIARAGDLSAITRELPTKATPSRAVYIV